MSKASEQRRWHVEAEVRVRCRPARQYACEAPHTSETNFSSRLTPWTPPLAAITQPAAAPIRPPVPAGGL